MSLKGLTFLKEKHGVNDNQIVDNWSYCSSLYSIFDKATRKFGFPIVSESDVAIKRTLADGLKQSAVSAHPDDYELYYLGKFDDRTGEISIDVVSKVCNMTELFVSNVDLPEFVKGDNNG